MTLIVDRNGNGAALAATDYDTNVDSLNGINVVESGTSLTIAATHQNDTVEFTNAGSVAVTLDLLATILAAIDTTDFKVTLLNTGAGTVTITPNGSNSINTGASTIVLETDEYVTIQNDNSNLIWNVINTNSLFVIAYRGGVITTHASSPFATTSGTSKNVPSIPDWVKKITVSLYRVSTGGTGDVVYMQVGDAGGLHTTGYDGSRSVIASGGGVTDTDYSASGLILNYDTTHTATCAYSGNITITREDSSNFNYVLSSVISSSRGGGLADTIFSATSVKLDTALTQLSLISAGGGSFDTGSFGVDYEG